MKFDHENHKWISLSPHAEESQDKDNSKDKDLSKSTKVNKSSPL